MVIVRDLSQLLGIYDNFDEPIPLSNKPTTILGVALSLQVCIIRFHPWWEHGLGGRINNT